VRLFTGILIAIAFALTAAHNYQQSQEIASINEQLWALEIVTHDIAGLTAQGLKRLTAASDRQREEVRALQSSDSDTRKALQRLDVREQAHYRRTMRGWSR
jgi:hypothetical protein